MKGVKFTAKEKERALKMWLEERKHWLYVCKKNKCTRVSLWRWKNQYDGTTASLENKSSAPKTPHPNQQTEKERNDIIQMLKENPTMGYTELWGELRQKCSYSRHYLTMYKFIRKNCLRPAEAYDVYVAQPYDTPVMLGVKWQMDVKFVPRECYVGSAPYEKLYQYTMLDEATRERFLFPYDHHDGEATVDFVRRAILYFGYKPSLIQTDNGGEFCDPTGKSKKQHKVDKLLKRLGIRHQRIRPRTPRHNGKVERSHRTDQERFYNFLKYSTFDELQIKMGEWLIRYNKSPSTALRNRHGKRVMQSPLDKRAELLEDLKTLLDADGKIYEIRFLKNYSRAA